jgi:hypothetical protein
LKEGTEVMVAMGSTEPLPVQTAGTAETECPATMGPVSTERTVRMDLDVAAVRPATVERAETGAWGRVEMEAMEEMVAEDSNRVTVQVAVERVATGATAAMAVMDRVGMEATVAPVAMAGRLGRAARWEAADLGFEGWADPGERRGEDLLGTARTARLAHMALAPTESKGTRAMTAQLVEIHPRLL